MDYNHTNMEEWMEYLGAMLPTEGWKPFWPTITTGGCGNCQYASIGGNLIRLQDCDGQVDLSDTAMDFNPEGWLWDG